MVKNSFRSVEQVAVLVLVYSSNWTALSGVTEISPGQFQFIDPQATNGPQRFYRVRSN